MARDKIRAELDELAAELGYGPSEIVRRARLKFTHPSGRIVFTGSRFNNGHGFANARAQLRRVATGQADPAGGQP